jgi:2'-5' RNA ligase
MTLWLSSIDLRPPGLEPVIGEWYATTLAAQEGMPPHCTLLYPWQLGGVTESQVAQVAAVAASFAPVGVRVARTGRFPGVLYLCMDSGGVLERLMRAVWDAFPQHPPYAGALGERPQPIPHITVIQGSEQQLDAVEPRVQQRLERSPMEFVVREVTISEQRAELGGRWAVRARIPLPGLPAREP